MQLVPSIPSRIQSIDLCQMAGAEDIPNTRRLYCNKLQLIIGRGRHITDISKPTFHDYQDGSLAEQEVQLKSTMGNLVCDA